MRMTSVVKVVLLLRGLAGETAGVGFIEHGLRNNLS